MRWISRLICDTSRGMMPSVGSSRMMSFGPHHQAAGDGEHLLLAAGQRISGLLEPFLEPREAIEHVVLRARDRVCREVRCRDFPDRQVRERCRVLAAHSRCPVRGTWCGAQAAEIECRRIPSIPALRGASPMMARSVVVLPTPLRPSSAADFAGLHLEVHALQDMQLADMNMDIVEAKHGRPPRHSPRPRDGRDRLRARARRPAISFGLPDASIAPCAITVMSSAMSNTTSMSCSMMTMSIVARQLADFLDRALGLRRAHAAGRLVEQQQAAARRSAPCRSRASPRRHRTACRRRGRPAPSSPICSSVRSTRSRRLRSRAAGRNGCRKRLPACRVIQRLSATLSCVNTLLICNVRLMPSRLISCGFSPVISRPQKEHPAAVGPQQARDEVEEAWSCRRRSDR